MGKVLYIRKALLREGECAHAQVSSMVRRAEWRQSEFKFQRSAFPFKLFYRHTTSNTLRAHQQKLGLVSAYQ